MENMPPPRVDRPLPASRKPVLRSAHNSKSSPLRPSAASVLSPRANTRQLASSGLLTPQASQQTVDMDAASTLISPPPEDYMRHSSRQQSSQPRFGSEPAQSLDSPATFASKRKRSNAPSMTNIRAAAAASIAEEDDLGGFGPGVEATLNPKPRKQKRREHQLNTSESPPPRRSKSPHPHSILAGPAHHDASPSKHIRFASPNAQNSNVDDVPPVSALNRPHRSSRGRSRSSTPAPAYEPPSERFTPPREIILTPTGSHAAPRVSKSSKRKSNGKVLKLVIKKELPEIDLSKPAPPPSPTDDPLLLHGPPRRKPASRASSITNARDTPPILSSPPDANAVSPPRGLDFSFTSAGASSPSAHEDELPGAPLFDFDHADDGSPSCSDREHDAFSLEGEFTGKFRMVSVPTKLDPPSSVTRERIESWGKPSSPFPMKTVKGKERAVEEDLYDVDEDQEMEDQSGIGEVARSPTPVTRTRSASPGRRGRIEFDEDEVMAGPEPQEDYMRYNARSKSPQAPPGDAGPSPDTSLEYPPSPPPAEPTRLSEPRQTLPVRTPSPAPPAPTRDDDMEEHDIPVAPFDDENELTQDNLQPRSDSPTSRTGTMDVQNDSGFEDGSGESSHSQQLDERRPSPQSHRSPEPQSFAASAVSPSKSLEEEELEDEVSVWKELSVEPGPMPEDNDDDDINFEFHVPSPEPEPEPEYSQDVDMANLNAYDDEGSSSEADQSVVEIVSDDPWAAARAAAILKSHDYDWIAKIGRKRSRDPSVESFSKAARRVDVSASGIRKSMSPRKQARRDSLAALKSRRLTLPQLLHEAEADVSCHESEHGTPARSVASPAPYAFRTPSPGFSVPRYSVGDVTINVDGPRAWEKNDWKLLDACFTDERLAMAKDGDILGDADLVNLDNVVDRFLDAMGGLEVVQSLGESWTRDDLLSRTRALQKKQRAGRIAPSTPTLRRTSASPSPFVPDFTPVRRRSSAHTLTLPRLNAPSFQKPPVPMEGSHVPSTLLAPRYSHIMDEVISIRDGVPRSQPPATPTPPAPAPPPPPQPTHKPRPSLGNRMKGFLFSYLPTMSKPKPAPIAEERLPGLPLPPPEVLEKPRGPIATPPAKPAPKPTHPKELVHLQHAPLPPSRLPLPTKRPPRRLVDLRPVSPVPEPSEPIRIPEKRRSSGGSVKDLVRSFEGLDKSLTEEQDSLHLSRQRSVGELKAAAKPQWKP